LVVEGLRRAIREAKRIGVITGVKIGRFCTLPHLLFVNDVLLFINGSFRESSKFKEILALYGKAIGMEINFQKLSISFNSLEAEDEQNILPNFPLKFLNFNEEFEYLSFLLKPNGYGKRDWGLALGKN
jgi:hypothetical protein